MHFLAPKPRPKPLAIDPNEYAHVNVTFDEFTGEIAVQMTADDVIHHITKDAACDCDDYPISGTCIHLQLAAFQLRQKEQRPHVPASD